MLEKLQLTNFRKHEDLVLDFVGGLNVVRGSNEAGKSTLQEAVGYALFGSKALRTTFADTVTWGRPESSLKVSLTVVLGGRKFTFARGKSGAEVTEDGRVTVTGQNEVTNYAAGLLGCDGTAAANLIIASQNAMRGSLEQGPKATAALIEQLADFDLFDTLIERIQSNLVVGAPATFEARVQEAKARLEAFQPAPLPDESAYLSAIDKNGREVEMLQSSLQHALVPAFKATEREYEDAEIRIKAYEEVQEELKRVVQTRADHLTSREQFKLTLDSIDIDPEELPAARQNLERLEKVAGAAAAYKLFKALPTCDNEYDTGYDDFSKWLEERAAKLQQLRDDKAEAANNIRVLNVGVITSSVCGFCGQDVSAFPEVAKKNAEVKKAIEDLEKTIDELTAAIPEVKAEVEAGHTIDKVTRQIQQTLPKLAGLVTVDEGVTPPAVRWIGAEPQAVDLQAARDVILRLEKEEQRAIQLAAKVDAMDSILKEDEAHVERMQEKAKHYKRPENADKLFQAYLSAQRIMQEAEAKISELKDDTSRRIQEFNGAMAVFNARQGERDRLVEAVASAKKDLEDLAFNNTLLKKVRTARPIIADKLWNTVLAAVSTMFSQMRGEASVVTKDNGGFKVNGQPIEALSGSTLDILGLAIRTALVKTFIPHAPFMLLDEAAAACDEDRTGSLLGFVAGSGFEQVVLVTHESASEAVADNVIQL